MGCYSDEKIYWCNRGDWIFQRLFFTRGASEEEQISSSISSLCSVRRIRSKVMKLCSNEKISGGIEGRFAVPVIVSSTKGASGEKNIIFNKFCDTVSDSNLTRMSTLNYLRLKFMKVVLHFCFSSVHNVDENVACRLSRFMKSSPRLVI